jgi:hypothetical protein
MPVDLRYEFAFSKGTSLWSVCSNTESAAKLSTRITMLPPAVHALAGKQVSVLDSSSQ